MVDDSTRRKHRSRTEPIATNDAPPEDHPDPEDADIIGEQAIKAIHNAERALVKEDKSQKKSPMADPWTPPDWKSEWGNGALVEMSSMIVLFPRWREKYLRDNFSDILSSLATVFLAAELNAIDGTLTVSTTKRTTDPYAIFRGRDMLALVSRGVPLHVASRILDDSCASDIIMLDALLPPKSQGTDRFVRRRNRLVGPDNKTLTAIELLTECFISVSGHSLAAIGSYRGVAEVRRIVTDCMSKNIHPAYAIKRLMIKRELLQREDMSTEDWARFLPAYNKKAKSKPGAAGDSGEGDDVAARKAAKAKKREEVGGKTDVATGDPEYAAKKEAKRKRKEAAGAAAYLAPDERHAVPVTAAVRTEDLRMESGEAAVASARQKDRKRSHRVDEAERGGGGGGDDDEAAQAKARSSKTRRVATEEENAAATSTSKDRKRSSSRRADAAQ